jgi:hypothetical protein
LAQPMQLPATPDFPHAGLRTVAFRSNAWPVAAALAGPPPLAAKQPPEAQTTS